MDTNALTSKQAPANAGRHDKMKRVMDWLGSSASVRKAVQGDPDAFAHAIVTYLAYNPDLLDCSMGTLQRAITQTVSLGLQPDPQLGQAYIIRRWSRASNGYEATFQLGYRGLAQLLWRSGMIDSLDAHAVYEGDQFEYQLGTEPFVRHVPTLGGDAGQIVAFYAIVWIKGGKVRINVMSRHAVDRVRDAFSESADKGYSPWKTSYEAMGIKTCFKPLCNLLPMSKDVSAAMRLATALSLDSEGTLPIAPHAAITATVGSSSRTVVSVADQLRERRAQAEASTIADKVRDAADPAFTPPDDDARAREANDDVPGYTPPTTDDATKGEVDATTTTQGEAHEAIMRAVSGLDARGVTGAKGPMVGRNDLAAIFTECRRRLGTHVDETVQGKSAAEYVVDITKAHWGLDSLRKLPRAAVKDFRDDVGVVTDIAVSVWAMMNPTKEVK